MARSHSTKRTPTKPEKPFVDFPLFPHASGRWAKKIHGKFHYFGKWDDAQGALDRYNAVKDDLHAGRRPKEEASDGKTVKELVNLYYNTQKARVPTGELTQRSLLDCRRIGLLVAAHFRKDRLLVDIRPEDFTALRVKLAKRLGLVALKNDIIRVRCVFNFAYKHGLVDRPVRYGAGFDLPTKKTMRRDKAKKGKKLFEAAEILDMLEGAEQPLKAMILLGINCGFGNADCGTLPLSALDLKRGWLNYPRPKTGIGRRCPLWPETIQALEEAIARRPAPKDEANADLVFITKYGSSWHKEIPDNPISKATRKLLNKLNIAGGRTFYALRHTFQTIGDDCGRAIAVRHIMGHLSDDISEEYRERVSDDSLLAATEFVRAWLFEKSSSNIANKMAAS